MNLNCILAGVILISSFPGRGQIDPVKFNKGDRFVKETFVNTNSVIQGDEDTLAISLSSHVTQLFSFRDSSAVGYTIRVTTHKIADTIASFGQQSVYTSENLSDSSSVIEKDIQDILSMKQLLYIDNFGKIYSIVANTVSYQQDSLLGFLDLYPKTFQKDRRLALVPDTSLLRLNFNIPIFTDSSNVNDEKVITTYVLDSETDSTISIQYTKSITTDTANTNTNGELLIDKNSGLLIENEAKSITVENQFLNGGAYIIMRKSAVIDRYRKL